MVFCYSRLGKLIHPPSPTVTVYTFSGALFKCESLFFLIPPWRNNFPLATHCLSYQESLVPTSHPLSLPCYSSHFYGNPLPTDADLTAPCVQLQHMSIAVFPNHLCFHEIGLQTAEIAQSHWYVHRSERAELTPLGILIRWEPADKYSSTTSLNGCSEVHFTQ